MLEIKASGGIYNIAIAEAMIEAGATRLGTSKGVILMRAEGCDCEKEDICVCECDCACGDECNCEDHECECGECCCHEEK